MRNLGGRHPLPIDQKKVRIELFVHPEWVSFYGDKPLLREAFMRSIESEIKRSIRKRSK